MITIVLPIFLDRSVYVCLQLADSASQLDSAVTLLSWRDQMLRLVWCIRFAPVSKRSEYVIVNMSHSKVK